MSDTRSIVNENGKRVLEIQDELDMQGKISRIRHDDVKKTIHQGHAGIISSQRRANILQWLSHTDPGSNHNEARSQCEAGTGRWFIEGDEYRKWKTAPSSFLWINGIPGSGKTVMCSTIIQDMMNNTKTSDAEPLDCVLFYYFSFQDREKQCLTTCVVSLLKQLASQHTDIPAALATLHEKCSNEKPTVDQILPVLQSVLQHLGHCYLVIDALDECPRTTSQRADVLTGLSTMATWKIPGLHILVTSRREPDIEAVLNSLVNGSSTGLEATQIDGDIRVFVENQLQTHPQLKKWPGDLKEEIKSALIDRADGMFRWVSCQLDYLAKCLKPNHIRKALKSLPQTLDETYARILQSIDEMYVQEVTTALLFLSFSMRQLNSQELAEAAVIDPDDDVPFDRFRDSAVILELLSSLVSVSTRDDGTDEVRLSHFTVKEYLLSDRILSGSTSKFQILELSAHKLICDISLRYITMFDKSQANERGFEELPLWLYACQYWYRHMNLVPEDHLSVLMVNRATDILRSTNWAKSLDPYHDKSSFRKCSPLCYSARLGLAPTTRRLLAEGTESNEKCYHCGHPLVVAIDRGSRTVVQILLENGAKPTSDDRPWATLHQAAYYGYLDAANLLIDAGAEVDATDENGSTALHLATLGGRSELCKLLIQKGASVDRLDHSGDSPLLLAVIIRHPEVVSTLCEYGARHLFDKDDLAMGDLLQYAHRQVNSEYRQMG